MPISRVSFIFIVSFYTFAPETQILYNIQYEIKKDNNVERAIDDVLRRSYFG